MCSVQLNLATNQTFIFFKLKNGLLEVRFFFSATRWTKSPKRMLAFNEIS